MIVTVKEGAVWPLLFIVRQGTGLLFKDEIKKQKIPLMGLMTGQGMCNRTAKISCQYLLYVHANKFFKIIVLKTWHFCFS